MVEWRVTSGLTDFAMALAEQQQRAAAIAEGRAKELVWLLEHPPLYTAGLRAKPEDLLKPDRFPVHHIRRGGEFTYHGPGQRVAYVLLDLNRRGRDIRHFVRRLETWIIGALTEFGVHGEPRADRVGIWVRRADASNVEDKIAAIGVQLRRWVSFHGIALNVSPDLSHFDGIAPCGQRRHGVTSLSELGVDADMNAVDAVLRRGFHGIFG